MIVRDNNFGECVSLEKNGVKAVIAPAFGMALVDFSVDSVQILDMARKPHFLETRKGLGPIILPHFNQWEFKPEMQEADFQHLVHLRKLGIKDPLQHGVGRYVPWLFEAGDDFVTGTLSGSTPFAGKTLAAFNSFDFSAKLTYRLTDRGLVLAFKVEGEKPVQTGIHFYYDLKNRRTARVSMPVAGGRTEFDFSEGYDLPFSPALDAPAETTYRLTTETYVLDTVVKVRGAAESIFESVILYSPADTAFVCVEPVSCHDRAVNKKRKIDSEILLAPKRLK